MNKSVGYFMSDIESTKKRLDVELMDKKEREALFDKFVNKGGKIIKDENESQIKTISSKTRNSSSNESQNKDNLQNKKPKSGLIPEKISDVKMKAGVSAKLHIWWDALKQGVITMTSKKISAKFYNFVEKKALIAIMEAHELISGSLYPPSGTQEEANNRHQFITDRITDDAGIELLQRFRMVYKKETYDTFLKHYDKRGDLSFVIDSLASIKAMIKQIHITRNYVDSIKSTADQVFITHGQLDKIRESVINNRMLLFRKDLNLIYKEFYPKLLSLLQYAVGITLDKEEYFTDILGLDEKDKIGYYTIQRSDLRGIEFNQLNNQKKPGPERSAVKQDKITEVGLSLIKNIVDYSKIKNAIKEDDNDPFFYVSEKDKIFRSKCIFDTFDNEYSPFIMSNKVKLNVMYDHNVKVDYSSEFNSQIMAIAELRSRYNEYASIKKYMFKIENDSGINYAQKNMLLKEKSAQCSVMAKKLRAAFVSIATELKKNIEKLMLDKSERERIIENPNDIVGFDVSLHGKKILSGKTVLQGLTEACYYIAGMYFLVVNGELSGAGIAIDEVKESAETKQEENDIFHEKETIEISDLQNMQNPETQKEINDSENIKKDQSDNSLEYVSETIKNEDDVAEIVYDEKDSHSEKKGHDNLEDEIILDSEKKMNKRTP